MAYNIDILKQKTKEINENIELCDDTYGGVMKKYTFKCLKCNSKFEKSFNAFSSKNYKGKCPYCETHSMFNLNMVKKRLKELNKNYFEIKEVLYDKDKITHTGKQLLCKCNICGYEWVDSFGNLQGKTRDKCPNCGKYKRITNEEINKKIKDKNPNLKILNIYRYKGQIKIKVKCLLCNQEYDAYYYNILKVDHICNKITIQSWFSPTFAENNKEKLSDVPAMLYIVKIFNENEEFFKIGITTLSLRKRFENLPYKFEILKINFLSLYDAIILEDILHKKYKNFKYVPKISFGGETECFNKIENIDIL